MSPIPPPAPQVSVVIPAYNRAATIAAAIESVLRQTWGDFELIVVDDGSTDGTLAAAAEVEDPRVRLVANPRNMGAAGARNTGVAEARGTWVAFQDSDDEWLPGKLEKQMARLAANPDFVGAYCGLLTVGGLDARPGERTELRYVPDPSVKPAEGDILEPLLERNMISTQTLVVRRDIFLALGCFDEATTPIEDWDFALRLAHRGSIASSMSRSCTSASRQTRSAAGPDAGTNPGRAWSRRTCPSSPAARTSWRGSTISWRATTGRRAISPRRGATSRSPGRRTP